MAVEAVASQIQGSQAWHAGLNASLQSVEAVPAEVQGLHAGAALDGAVPPVPARHAETRAVLTLAVQRAPGTRTRG